MLPQLGSTQQCTHMHFSPVSLGALVARGFVTAHGALPRAVGHFRQELLRDVRPSSRHVHLQLGDSKCGDAFPLSCLDRGFQLVLFPGWFWSGRTEAWLTEDVADQIQSAELRLQELRQDLSHIVRGTTKPYPSAGRPFEGHKNIQLGDQVELGDKGKGVVKFSGKTHWSTKVGTVFLPYGQ